MQSSLKKNYPNYKRGEPDFSLNLSSIEILFKDSLPSQAPSLAQEGRDQIIHDFKDLGSNLAQIPRGLSHNILTQSLLNTLRDSKTNLIEEMKLCFGQSVVLINNYFRVIS